METTNRPKAAFIKKILKEGHNFNYIQLLRLFEVLKRDSDQKINIRTRPALSFEFPSADISHISFNQTDNEKQFDIIATFLGLYGVSSPLPNFYTEDLFLERSEDKSTIRDFLDIFNQRIYYLFYECWRRYRLFFNVTEDKKEEYLNIIFCLLGLGEKEFKRKLSNPERLFRYLGLITQWPRSGLGLQSILRDISGINGLEIEYCILRSVSIPKEQRCSLGSQCSSLGIDTVIGTNIKDRQGKFRIKTGILNKDEFRKILPGTIGYKDILAFTRFYLPIPLDYEILVEIAGDEINPVSLGSNWANLGFDTWVFSGKMKENGQAIFYPTKGGEL